MDLNGVLEEIALEGLDGITLDALWMRITTRPDNDPGILDDYVKEYVWRHLTCCRELEFFKLPEPRPDLVITNYQDYCANGRCVLDAYPADIYSIEKVEQDGVIGSCDDYHTRVFVIDEIRGEGDCVLLTVKEAHAKWGQQLVIVASQSLRNLALFGTNYKPYGVGPEVYSVVERVARSRTNGAITLPLPSGRGVINKYVRSSNLFAIVRDMCDRGILRKQPFNIRLSFTGRSFHIRLVHLARFHVESAASFLKMLEKVCQVLKEAPNFCLTRFDMVERSGVRNCDAKKHWMILSKFVSRGVVNYREIYPNATPQEYKSKGGIERKIVVYTLIKPFSSRKELEDADDVDNDGDDDDADDNNADFDDGDDDGGDDEENFDTGTRGELLPLRTGPLYEMTYSRALLYAVDKAGPSGITLSRINGTFGLQKKMMARVINTLIDQKMIINVPAVNKKAKQFRLVSWKYENELRERGVKQEVKEEPVPAEEDAETVVQNDAKEGSVGLDLAASASGSQAGDGNLSGEGEDLDQDTPRFDLEEESLDETLSDLELTWWLEKEPQPKQMSAQLSKLMVARKRYRRNYVLKFLEKNTVCVNDYELRKKIIAWEAGRGIKEAMCRKSFIRIAEELYNEGKISHIMVQYQQQKKTQTHTLIAALDTDASARLVKEAVLHFFITKYKYFVSLSKKKDPRFKRLNDLMMKGVDQGPFSYSETLSWLSYTEGATTPTPLPKAPPDDTPLYNDVGSKAKVRKASELHMFMFYVLYGYPDSARARSANQDQSIMDLDPSFSETDELPVYLDVDDWRRHIPPLKIHNTKYLNRIGVEEGACMLGDLLMVMPIYTLCRIVYFEWKVEGLGEILADPKQRYRLLYTLPAATIRDVCKKGTYVRKILYTFTTLCRMGLASYGPPSGLKPLEYTVMFVHKRAMLLDTMKSLRGRSKTKVPPPDTEFPRIHFEFDALSDIDAYWKEAQLVCMATHLGQFDSVDTLGDNGEITLDDSLKPRPFDQIKQDNWLPGDRRGAAGFDSSMYMHRSSSWDYKKMVHKTGTRQGGGVRSLLCSALTQETVKAHPTRKASASKTKPPGIVKKAVRRAKDNLATKTRLPRKRKRKESRTIDGEQEPPAKSKSAKSPKLALDEEDRQAKMEMARLRSHFTPFENGIFLLCHVVSFIMCPKDLNFRLNTMDMRTIFKSLAPVASKDKTTNAIKGKSARLIKDENFLSHMAIYVAKTRYDPVMTEMYKDFKYSHSPKHRVAMFQAFSRFVKKLHLKFCSPAQPLSYDIPPKTSDFHSRYQIKLAIDHEYLKTRALPKVSFDVNDPSDVRATVLWDLILGWVHSRQNINNLLVYHILCQYPQEAVSKTHAGLKGCRVMYTNKKYAYKKGQRTLTPTDQAVSNLILSKRHKEKLLTHYPQDLFSNALKQLQQWEKHFNKTHPQLPWRHYQQQQQQQQQERQQTTTSTSSVVNPAANDEDGDTSASSIRLTMTTTTTTVMDAECSSMLSSTSEQCSSKNNKNSISSNSSSSNVKTDHDASGDVVDMDVDMDDGGREEKKGEEREEKEKKREEEEGEEEKEKKKRQEEGVEKEKKKREIEGEEKEKKKREKEWEEKEKKREEEGEGEKGTTTTQAQEGLVLLETSQLLGGSMMALLPLMALDLVDVEVTVPDNMVRLSEEGIRRLTMKRGIHKRKAKDAGLDTSFEDSDDDNDDDDDVVDDGDDDVDDESMRDNRNWRKLRCSMMNRKRPMMPSASTSAGVEGGKDGDDDNDDDAANEPFSKWVKLGNTRILYNSEGANTGDILLEYAMAFASGTLLALARTHVLQELDLLHTDVNVQRYFIVDSLVMKFGLKACSNKDVVDGDGDDGVGGVDGNGHVGDPRLPCSSDYSRNGAVVSARGGGGGGGGGEEEWRLGDHLDKSMGTSSSSSLSSSSPSSSSRLLKINTTESDAEHTRYSSLRADRYVGGDEISNRSSSSSHAGTMDSHSRPVCDNVNAKKKLRTNAVSALYNPDLYARIVTRLEQTFSVDYGERDVYPELDSITHEGGADSEWVERGRGLFSLIDSSGPNGLTEPDLEDKLKQPLPTFLHVIDKLCDMNAFQSDVKQRYCSRTAWRKAIKATLTPHSCLRWS